MTKAGKQYTVSVETLASHGDALIQYLQNRGDYASLLAQYGEEIQKLAVYQARARVPIDEVACNLNLIAQWLHEPNLGLKVSPYSSRQQNRLAYFFQESRLSLLDYFRMLARYLCISSEVVRIEVVATAQNVALHVLPNCVASISIHQTEGFVASLCDLVKQARKLTPVAIDLAHANPDTTGDTTIYESVLGVVPAFNQPRTRILFVNDAGDVCATRHHPSKASVSRIQLMEAVKRKEIGEERWTDRCRFLLEILMYYGEPHKNVLAELLAVTPRTLQRRLGDEGETYRHLLTELRKELALQHLADSRYTSDEVAFLLGYQDVSHFSRAFKTWFGVSPGQSKSGVTPAQKR
ncbi:MAG: hypothetical protein CSH49_07760 [Alcanivorax sp.]|nr:MAG: hypothetical protein CSH49_07760 [Alcanivorax sp.]